MTKAQIKLLEKVFAAEIDGRLHQSKAKGFKALEADGCVEEVYHKVGRDRFGPIVVTGWALTHRGRIIYCEWASKQILLNEKITKAIPGDGGEQSPPVHQPLLPDSTKPGAVVPHRVRRLRKNSS